VLIDLYFKYFGKNACQESCFGPIYSDANIDRSEDKVNIAEIDLFEQRMSIFESF
jgi:hypothetical protein